MLITIFEIIFWTIISAVGCVGLSYLYDDFAKTAKENNLYKRY